MGRRQFVLGASAGLQGVMCAAAAGQRVTQLSQVSRVKVLYTFGDSILDCAPYNTQGVHPGQLLVRNNDVLFPEFHGRDLQSLGPARLEHRAVDGATVRSLPGQARKLSHQEGAVAILTIGGNDLLAGLAADKGKGKGIEAFASLLEQFLVELPVRPVFLGNVYDPTFGDDARNFLGVPAGLARVNHRRVNEVIARLARRTGGLVDLHGHFLQGDPSWFTRTIEPSLRGASEVRRAFMPALGLA
ncbi:MAG: SGNH/GDSL hydrolase family protein [Pseudomonadota bacterium]